MSELNILHVDDEPFESELLKMRFERLDSSISFQHVASVPAAEELLTRNKAIDCIISDYQMPVSSGLDFLRNLRSRGVKIPFIFLTGQGNEKIAAEALRVGADDYFPKDSSLAHYERLLHSIRRIVTTYHLQQEHQKATRNLRQTGLCHMAFTSLEDPVFVIDGDAIIAEVNNAGRFLLGTNGTPVNGTSLYSWTVNGALRRQLEKRSDARLHLEINTQDGRHLRHRAQLIKLPTDGDFYLLHVRPEHAY